MPSHLIWTYRSRALVVWNVTHRWNNWNFGEIHPRSGAWVSFGRIAGREAARRAAQNQIDIELRHSSLPRSPGAKRALRNRGRDESRSMVEIDMADLAVLGNIAAEDRRVFFSGLRKCHRLSSRVLGVALCQGAALHFIDKTNGVKDFDVWTFFAATSGHPFPPRRTASRDFGLPKFGKSPDRPDYVGRRVDLLGRSISATLYEDPVLAIQRYLRAGETESARRLREKAVIMIEPTNLRGTIAWPSE
jgi:hypothetical protein